MYEVFSVCRAPEETIARWVADTVVLGVVLAGGAG